MTGLKLDKLATTGFGSASDVHKTAGVLKSAVYDKFHDPQTAVLKRCFVQNFCKAVWVLK